MILLRCSQGPSPRTADVPPGTLLLQPSFTYHFIPTRIIYGTADSGVKHIQATSPLGAKASTTAPLELSLMKPTVMEFNPGLRSVKQKCDTGKTQEAMKPDRHLF